MMSKNYLTMTDEEWKLLGLLSDEGFSFERAMILVFGEDIISVGVLSEDGVELMLTYQADRLMIETTEDPETKATLKKVAGVSGRMAELTLHYELKVWQNENWNTWGQSSH